MAETTEKTATKPTVKLVDWYADWCGPCRAMEPVLHEIEHEFAGKITIEKIDVDKEGDRANAAGVMSMPTFHIMKDDKIMQTLIGYQAKEELAKHLKAALED